MGNKASRSPSKLIFCDGAVRSLDGNRRTAGEIMMEFPDRVICHADSFYIGRPIPSLAIGDPLLPGETYFVLPVDRFRSGAVLSTSSLAALRAQKCPIDFGGEPPFKHIKSGSSNNGAVSIKVSQEFMERLVSAEDSGGGSPETDADRRWSICTTPELRKRYDQLVGSAKVNEWSPKLETVPEVYNRNRGSPCMRLRRMKNKTWTRVRL